MSPRRHGPTGPFPRFARLLSAPAPIGRKPRRRRSLAAHRALRLESLESRAMLSSAPFIASLPQDLAGKTASLVTVHGRYGNNALNGDWELGLTSNTSAPPQKQVDRIWNSGAREPFTFSFTNTRPDTFTNSLNATFSIGGSGVQFDYGSQFASYEPNAIKIWASTATATSGLTINDLRITTPGVTGQTVFPGASIAVSQASGTVFQEIIIAGIDFQSGSGGTVTLQGNVTMQFGADPALRGSALQFHVIATHIPWVDLDVDSNNNGSIDPVNGRRGTDDRIEQAAAGKIIPVGGDRAEMLITLPAGRSATLEIDAAVADKVRVFDPTGKEVLNAQTHSTTVSGSSPQMFSIQALAPSTTAGDIVFTLTGDSSGPSARDLVRATALVFSIDGPGEIDADTRRGWVSLLVNPDDYGPVDRAADGLPVQFRVFRNGVPAFTSSVDIADGAAVLPVPTSTVPGDTYNVEGWFAGRKIGATVFPIVAGAPATITPSAPQGSIVTDGQRVITVTADIRDRHGNVVEDGTPVEWLLENLSSSFASLPTRFSSVTSGGRAEVSFRAPDTLSSPVVRIRSGSATRLVELPATFTTATLAGPVSLNIATAESGTVTLATDATDGTPVFWTISNGDIRTYAGVVGGGQAQLAVAATGIWGRVGPCVVTATVGGRLAVHVIDFYSSDPFFLEIDRFVLCGDKTEDGEETLHFPAVTPLPFAPSVVPDTSRAVPYPATATVTIHGVPNGTYAVEFTDPASVMLAEIVSLDPSGRVQLSGNGQAPCSSAARVRLTAIR